MTEKNPDRHPDNSATRWAYAPGVDELVATPYGAVTRTERLGQIATTVLDTEGPISAADIDLAHAAAYAENELRVAARQANNRDREQIKRIDSIVPNSASHVQNLAEAKSTKLTQIYERGTGVPERLADSALVVRAVIEALDDRERVALERVVQDRIEANRFPWTMPGIDEERAAELRSNFETMFGSSVKLFEPLPDDTFSINVLRNVGCYADEDKALVGADKMNRYTNTFTRQELVDAGVFFVNSVGDGEQPIFGEPIPDTTQPDGFFHPERRVFLTREELDKVYAYQMQKLDHAGINIGEVDIPQLQLELMMLARTGKLPAGSNARVLRLGGRERDPKGDAVRSPFVSSGHKALISTGATICNGDGANLSDYLRFNTTSLALLNGHPDYPGLSEMRMTNPAWKPEYVGLRLLNSASHDQRYANLQELLQSGWLPSMPTREETLHAIRTGGQTQREIFWLTS